MRVSCELGLGAVCGCNGTWAVCAAVMGLEPSAAMALALGTRAVARRLRRTVFFFRHAPDLYVVCSGVERGLQYWVDWGCLRCVGMGWNEVKLPTTNASIDGLFVGFLKDHYLILLLLLLREVCSATCLAVLPKREAVRKWYGVRSQWSANCADGSRGCGRVEVAGLRSHLFDSRCVYVKDDFVLECPLKQV